MDGRHPNAELVLRVFEDGWNRGAFDFLAGRTAERIGFTYNGHRLETAAEELPGLVGRWREAFPDLSFEVRHLVHEGDLVAVSLVFHGTHRGAWMGIAPSGARVEVEEMMFFRFEDDTLVEMWELFDEATLTTQLTPPSTE